MIKCFVFFLNTGIKLVFITNLIDFIYQFWSKKQICIDWKRKEKLDEYKKESSIFG